MSDDSFEGGHVITDEDDFVGDFSEGEVEEENEVEIEIENKYYQSKELEEEVGIPAALQGFEAVMEMEKALFGAYQKYSFKSLKKILRLLFKQGNKVRLTERYNELLTFNSAKNSISEQELFKGITKILDTIGTGSSDTTLVLSFYEIALKQMKLCKNDTLWFKTYFKLASRLFDKQEFATLHTVLPQLEASCKLHDGSDDPKKINQLLDVLALAIQFYLELKGTAKTKQLHDQAFAIFERNPGILNSKMAVFHFVGGKLSMEQKAYEAAYGSFFEAFNFFEDGSSSLKVPCLKYIVLSAMLRGSTIDPFNSAETANLKNHKEIRPLAELLDSFQHREFPNFERIINQNKRAFERDPFFGRFIQELFREIRTQILVERVQPYSSIALSFLGKELNLSVEAVSELLVALILDKKIEGRIDQVKKLLLLEKEVQVAKYRCMSKWNDQLESLHVLTLNRVN